MTPKIGDVVEVYVGSTYRGIGILVPKKPNETVNYSRFVQWISVLDRDHCYDYISGDYGIDAGHTLKVICSLGATQ